MIKAPLILISIFLFSYASKKTDQDNYTGFLKDYSKL